MTAFEYEALDQQGRAQKGVLSADSARLARRELRRRSLLPVQVRATGEDRARMSVLAGSGRRLTARELALVTRQLATLIDAGAPVEQALHNVAMQADRDTVRRSLLAVREAVAEGAGFAEALSREPQSFGPVYRAMVSAGEASGSLGPVLERLAEELERGEALRRKVRGALVYPMVLALTALGVIVALMVFVVPRVIEQFDTVGRELPFLTRMLIGISDWLIAYGGPVGILALGFTAAVPALLKRPSIKRSTDAFILRLPLISALARKLYAARTARTLSALVGSGAPMVEALGAARVTITNSVLRERLENVAVEVREGSALSAALSRAALFPSLVTFMAASGEQSGRLSAMLDKAADYLEAEFRAAVDTALALLEPAIILIMGGIVATVVLAILLPILRLNTAALL